MIIRLYEKNEKLDYTWKIGTLVGFALTLTLLENYLKFEKWARNYDI